MINAEIRDGQMITFDKDEKNFDEDEYKKIVKTQNQGLVKYQKYKLMKKIERMKPDLTMISAPSINKKVLIVDNEEQLKNAKKSDFESKSGAGRKQGLLGKRNIEEDGFGDLTESELKYAMQGKKESYRKLASAMLEHKKMEDYYLKIDQEKSLLVSFIDYISRKKAEKKQEWQRMEKIM